MAELLSRQGPLAHVWLASNYDRKLSKTQLLNTNIIASSNIISTSQIQSSDEPNSDTITLRLSGQLLLGIVRIYSRKTKYLLDDINECLHKLKTSFRYASGASLGSSALAVNLPPPRTTITNFSRHLMQDQVTELDLFYQEDLNLDDETVAQTNHDMLFSQVSSLNHSEDTSDIDHSIELARRHSGQEPDMGMDLDFDLDLDQSIEQGRDAQAPMSEADQSVLDLSKGPNSPILGSDDFGLGGPLETIDERETNEPQVANEPLTPPPQAAPAQVRRLVGVTNDGVIKTTKRRLVVDNAEELQRGLSIDVLKSIQHMQTHGRFTEETLTLKLTDDEKLQLIEELAAPASSKRRKIWNLDHELRQRCVQLSNQEQRMSPDESISFDLDNSLDFDLSLPALVPDNEANAKPMAETQGEEDENAIDNVKGTTQVAEHLRRTFFEQPTIKFDELMDRDMKDEDNVPLGAIHKSSDIVKVSQRREATKCFFELLVLATHNCVSLEQDEAEDLSLLGKNLTIRPRDNLVSRFL